MFPLIKCCMIRVDFFGGNYRVKKVVAVLGTVPTEYDFFDLSIIDVITVDPYSNHTIIDRTTFLTPDFEFKSVAQKRRPYTVAVPP